MSHWKVRFTLRGMEPPRPFGKTSRVVCAASRGEAKDMFAGQASPNYPLTAAPSREALSFGQTCHCPPLSDDRIRALRGEAAEAGDLEQVAICDVALGGAARPRVRGCEWTREAARAECARVIAEGAG